MPATSCQFLPPASTSSSHRSLSLAFRTSSNGSAVAPWRCPWRRPPCRVLGHFPPCQTDVFGEDHGFGGHGKAMSGRERMLKTIFGSGPLSAHHCGIKVETWQIRSCCRSSGGSRWLCDTFRAQVEEKWLNRNLLQRLREIEAPPNGGG